MIENNKLSHIVKYKITLTFVLMTSVSFTFAQQSKDSNFKGHSNNVLKINTIGAFSKFIEISYERVITDAFSAAITYGNSRTKTISGDDAEQNYLDKYHGLVFNFILGNTEQKLTIKQHLSFEFRYYLSHKNALIPAGFHIAPSLNFLNYNENFIFYDDQGIERDSRENDYKIVSINVGIGPQILIHRIVSIDAFIAPGYGILSGTDGGLSNSNAENFSGAGFTLAYGLFCGIAIGK